MARLKGVISEIKDGRARILLDDGVSIILPLDKLPRKISEGTFVTLSIQIDHMTALLNRAGTMQLLPKGRGAT